jgi:alpha-tubulin suppressor-like RCC1 family protein
MKRINIIAFAAIIMMLFGISNNLLAQYCSCSTSSKDEYIIGVAFNSINNQVDAWSSTVADYTNISTDVIRGSTYDITVKNKTAYSTDQVYVWIDLNRDTVFSTSTEQFILSTTDGGTYFKGSITIPTTVSPGKCRMRIRMVYNSTPTPCGSSNFGEVEDYSVNILATPLVATTSISDITTNSATSGGNVTDNGGYSVTARGVCWSISPNPTTANSKTTNGNGTGSFSSNITQLTHKTTYYVKAYATNEKGTAYGEQISFTTVSLFPTLTTIEPTEITKYSATSGGNITNDGGSSVTARGVCWNTSGSPTIADSKTSNGTGTGTFTSSISNLTPYTQYYIRAYATNSNGTDYGEEFSFTTGSCKMYGWGYNGYGQLGDGTTTQRTSQVQIANGVIWSKIASGHYHTLAVKSDGTLWAWGYNGYGQLGDGTTSSRTSPVQIGINTNWSKIACGYGHTIAIKKDGTLWAWGINYNGELGDGTTTTRTSPVQIGTGTSWTQVVCGSSHTIAIKSDGTLWAWGYNGNGQLGDGTTTTRTSPVQIGTGTSWTQVVCGSSHTIAFKSDGTLWAWGYNGYGQLGDGTTTDKTSPTQIGTGTNWSQADCGSYHTIAIKSDGTLWAWGYNYYGQLGDGTTTSKTSPVQIGTGTNWSKIACGYYHTTAIKSDGTLWAWGNNYYGQLGDGTTTDKTSPVQIGTETFWYKVDCGYYNTIALNSFLLSVSTTSISSLTTTSFSSGGNVLADGGASVTARGVCWSSSPNPTTANSKTTNGTGLGSFTSSITGLTPNTTYYLRAYATNSIGTRYGDIINFATAINLTTTAVSNISMNIALSGGTIALSDSNTAISARGVCWSTSPYPTIANSKSTDGTGTGSFTSVLIGLTPNTKYYVRAYATNFFSASYGNQDSLITIPLQKKLKVRAILNGLWANDKHLPALVFIELRTGNTLPSSSVSKRIACSLDTLGWAEGDFGELTAGDYWLVVRATGYLPIAAPSKISLSTAGVEYDFTTGSDKSVSGTSAMIQPVNPGPWMMRGGDFNNSRSVTATDINQYFLPNNGKNVASTIPAP